MFQNVSNFKRQTGISLLELMLSLAIIAVILTMATRFFTQANQSQNLNNAVSMGNGVVAAVQNYHMNGGNLADVSIQKLIDANMLPKDFGGPAGNGVGANPWGGDIAVAQKNKQITITFTAVPYTGDSQKGLGGSCDMLAARLNKTYNDAKCESGTVTFSPAF